MTLKNILSISYHHFKLLFRKSKYDSKIFCIGFNKTGTTSLGKSFEILGLRNSSFNKKIWQAYKKGDINKVLKYTSKFDSCDDLPWLNIDMIPILDETFPNSKFVYLEREEKSWKNSFESWRLKVYGEKPNVDEGWQDYKDHERFVLNYFKNWPNDRFIILDITDPDGFRKLADFLEIESGQSAFPRFNKT